ncbi:hypothetical protein [Chitinimonas sp.]|uniref:hypothetical protein n=1 Tax=Chitinimonas sp. TaxID=1934313 RepID=UPI0035B21F48
MNKPAYPLFALLRLMLACLLVHSAFADCYTGPANGSALSQTMTISLPAVTYNLPLANNTVLASTTVANASSSDGTSGTFVCRQDNINNYTTVRGSWSGNSGTQAGFYRIAGGLYLRLTFTNRNARYPFGPLDLNGANGTSMAQLAELVYVNDGSGNPRLPGGFANTEVASFAEPNCVSNPSSYLGLNCLNVRIRLSVGAVMPDSSCTANVPSAVSLGTLRSDQVSNTTWAVTSFQASLSCSVTPTVSMTLTGPASSSGIRFANTGTASPLWLLLSYAGQNLSSGQSFSLPASGANSSWTFGVSTFSNTPSVQPGTIQVPVTWTIVYQ